MRAQRLLGPALAVIGGGAEHGEAAVNVSQIWNPGSDFESVRDLMVYLVTVDGRWLIDEIVCPAPEEAYPQMPDAVVMAFYNWYLDYTASGNPLVDKAYHDSPYLMADFAKHVDEIIAGFDRGGYDPSLCAQDVPDYIMPQSFIMNGPTPSILVQTSFAHHFQALVAFGEAGLLALLQANRSQTAVAILQAILQTLADFTGTAPQFDDVAMMALRRQS